MPTSVDPISQPGVPFPQWKAPSEDVGSVLWPTADLLIEQTRENHRRLASCASVRIQNQSLNELRRRTRIASGQDDEQLLIATGHQIELHHPGVWAKNLLLNAISPLLDARALHIAVDTDAPKHLNLRWPGVREPQSLPMSDDPEMTKAAWSGLLPPARSEWIEHLHRMTDADPSLRYPLHGDSMLPDFFAKLRESSEQSTSLDQSLSVAMHELDRSIGLNYESVVASTLWDAEGFLTFAHHLLAHARTFTVDYNAALADYRTRSGIRSTMRPMPDLFTGHGAVEAPFWLDDCANGTRIRPSVFDDGDGFRLDLLNGEQFFFDPSRPADEAAAALAGFLRKTNHRLSPRALTLTMFVRLLLADQFVHGIGGGRYDQVTDEIIRRHFQLEPPTFSVTTATLLYPGAAGRERVCLPCLVSEGHVLRHAVLGADKAKLLKRIDELPRKSAARSEAFAAMQRERHLAIATDEGINDWQSRFADGAVQHTRDKTIFDRELFYAVQPRDRLELLIARYQEMFHV